MLVHAPRAHHEDRIVPNPQRDRHVCLHTGVCEYEKGVDYIDPAAPKGVSATPVASVSTIVTCCPSAPQFLPHGAGNPQRWRRGPAVQTWLTMQRRASICPTTPFIQAYHGSLDQCCLLCGASATCAVSVWRRQRGVALHRAAVKKAPSLWTVLAARRLGRSGTAATVSSSQRPASPTAPPTRAARPPAASEPSRRARSRSAQPCQATVDSPLCQKRRRFASTIGQRGAV